MLGIAGLLGTPPPERREVDREAVGRGSRSPPHPSPFQGEGVDCCSLGAKRNRLVELGRIV